MALGQTRQGGKAQRFRDLRVLIIRGRPAEWAEVADDMNMAAGASAIGASSGRPFACGHCTRMVPRASSVASPVRRGTRRPKIRRRRLSLRHRDGYPDVIRITYHHLESGFCPFSTGWLREARPERLRPLTCNRSDPSRPVTRRARGMLASYSNSKAEIRRTWMGPPPDRPPSPPTKPILLSLHCTRYDEIRRSIEGTARVKRGVPPARTSEFNRQGNVGLPNDDGVANANTPSSTSQSLGSDNRQVRLERAPKP